MPRPYSTDLRERAVEAVESGASRREIAEIFKVGVSSVIRWCQRWSETGSAAPNLSVSPRVVAKYMARGRRPPSQGWKTFLHNHADGIAAMDLFVVPTVSVTILASCTRFR